MIKGRFGNTTGTPYVEGEIHLPRFKRSAGLSFLVDTGADRTVIMPGDGLLILALDYSKLIGSHPSLGIGGGVNHFTEEAILMFTDPNVAVHLYQLQVLISPPSAELLSVPSLLGRDILNNWRMVYDPHDGGQTLTFEVMKAQMTIKLNPPAKT